MPTIAFTVEALKRLKPPAESFYEVSDAQTCCCPRMTGQGHGVERAVMNSRGER
jgi:hypothetical protein